MLTDGLSVFFFGCCLLALLLAIMVVAETVRRLASGPVRFRLGLCSMAKTDPRFVTILIGFLGWTALAAIFAMTSLSRKFHILGELWIAWSALNWLWYKRRREETRGLGVASALIALLGGTAGLVDGLRVTFGAGGGFTRGSAPLFITLGVLCTMLGLVQIDELIAGTRVRERGIQLFATTQPWSRIAVRSWEPRPHDMFDLQLIVRSPRLLGRFPYAKDSLVSVPVSAAERPALETFLGQHAASVG